MVAARSAVKSPEACWKHLECGGKLVTTQPVAEPALAAKPPPWRRVAAELSAVKSPEACRGRRPAALRPSRSRRWWRPGEANRGPRSCGGAVPNLKSIPVATFGKRKEAPAHAGAPCPSRRRFRWQPGEAKRGPRPCGGAAPSAHLKGERRRTRGAEGGVEGPQRGGNPPLNPPRVSHVFPLGVSCSPRPLALWACCPAVVKGVQLFRGGEVRVARHVPRGVSCLSLVWAPGCVIHSGLLPRGLAHVCPLGVSCVEFMGNRGPNPGVWVPKTCLQRTPKPQDLAWSQIYARESSFLLWGVFVYEKGSKVLIG